MADDETTFRVDPASLGTTALVGHSRRGSIGRPQSCASQSEFNRHFGDHVDAPLLAAAVEGFFKNGGRTCIILNLGERERTLQPVELAPLLDLAQIELVCAPGKNTPADHEALIAHCAERGTRLALLDGPREWPVGVTQLRPPSSPHAAYYVPWLLARDPARAADVPVPPSGHMAGLMTRVAYDKSPRKAPANEPILGIVELTHHITKPEQDFLHPRRINCIRRLPQLDGFRPWSAQTLAAGPGFQSVAAFRVCSYVMRSFETGCPWLTGRASEPALWERLVEAGCRFLGRLREAGGLAGESEDQAFRLRCDEQLNPNEQRERGVVILEIGLAIGRPGSFFTFRMGLDLRHP